MSKKPDIKEGFKGMDFAKESKLFNEMPGYKSKQPKKRTMNELRQTKDAVYTNPPVNNDSNATLRKEAKLFLDKNFPQFKEIMNEIDYTLVITALVKYKNNQ